MRGGGRLDGKAFFERFESIPEPFAPAQPYRGDFPDPSVIRVGNRFFAHATNTHGLTLPTLVSTNLRRWWARPASAGNPTGDGMIRTPRHAQQSNLT